MADPRFGQQMRKRRKPNNTSKKQPAGRTRLERSAGVVLFREDKTVPGGRQFLLLDYGRHWEYPKGHVERGEDDRAAALRELAEETGIRAAQLLPGFQQEIVYFFHRRHKGLVRKTVIFFLATTATREVQLSDEHVGYAWLPAEESLRRLTYPTARRVFTSAMDFLARADAQRPDCPGSH